MNVNRRDFLKIGMLSASALTFSACGRPVEHGVVSQYQMPEYKLPGLPVFWASVCTQLRSDSAVSVKTVEGRAIQVVGTPGHFFSKGKTTIPAISSLQELYHPGRLDGADGTIKVASEAGAAVKKAGDKSLFIVDRLFGSTGDAIVEAAKAAGGKIWVCDSLNSVRERRILKAVVGRAELPLYPLEQHDFVVTVGSNFICENYAPSRTAWSYGRFRKTPGKLRGNMVSFSARMTATDGNADLWIPVKSGGEAVVVAALGTLLAQKGKGSWPSWASIDVEEAAAKAGVHELDQDEFVASLTKLAGRLAEAKKPLVVGGFQGANGETTVYLAHTLTKMLSGDVTTFEPDTLVGAQKDAADLIVDDAQAAEMLDGCKALVIHGVDVVYRFPWLKEKVSKVKKRWVVSVMPNETTSLSGSEIVPAKTWLEDWSDLMVSSPDGDWYGVGQPAVHSESDKTVSVLGFFLEVAAANGATLGNGELNARKYLRGERDKADWEALLVRGGSWKAELDPIYPHKANYPPPAVDNKGEAPKGYSPYTGLSPLESSSLEGVAEGKVFVVLPTHLGEGEMSDRSWLQEMPDLMTTVVWDSWIEINEEECIKNQIQRHDIVEVSTPAGTIRGSAYPSPFIHPDTIGVPSGRGKEVKAHTSIVELDWVSDGSNPKALLPGALGSSGYFRNEAAQAKLEKKTGSKLLATFDQRVFNLPRHILPE